MEKTIATITSSLAILFATLYAAGVILLAPISFLAFQVRVADCLLPLTILFGWPAIIGLTAGCFVANWFGGLGIVDVLGGSLANFVAGLLAWKIGQRTLKGSWFIGTILQNLTVTLIVGSYLWLLLAIPGTTISGITIPGFAIGWLGVFLGSTVAINILGYSLLKTLSRPSLVGPLKARGVKVYGK